MPWLVARSILRRLRVDARNRGIGISDDFEFATRLSPLAIRVARDLLGMTLASVIGGARVSGVIVETEAYLGVSDPASHAWRGRRHRLYQGIWAPAGSWYVYRSYGIHWCLNLTAPTDEDGGAVLIRAVTARDGVDVMRKRRGGVPDSRLADGPGKLTQAFGITGAHDGMRATRRAPVRLLPRREPIEAARIVAGPRVGISRAVEWPLRFCFLATADGLSHRRTKD